MKLVFTDLDDTLFASARRQVVTEDSTVASVKKDGSPSGYQNASQRAMFEALQQFGEIVPVTARTLAALQRVHLPFSKHIVWNFGASVQIDGEIDQVWRNRMVDIFIKSNKILTPLWQDIRDLHAECDEELVTPTGFEGLVTQWGLRAHTPEQAHQVKHTLESIIVSKKLPFWVHNQSEKWLYMTPIGVGKHHAVEHVINTLKPQATIGAGDNPSDIPFMKLCDYTVFPSKCFALRNVNGNM